MYLNENIPGACLTVAYGIQKGSAPTDIYERPTNEPVRTVQKVVYDEHQKSKRKTIIKTPDPLTTGRATQSSKKDTSTQTMNYLEAGAIIAAAEDQGEGFKYWARFCYSPDSDREWVSAGRWVSYQLFTAWAYLNRRKTKLPIERVHDLAMLCALDSVSRYNNKKSKYTQDQICQALGYKNAANANYLRTIQPHFDFMGRILDIHNGRMLAPVKTRIYQLRYDSEKQAVNA